MEIPNPMLSGTCSFHFHLWFDSIRGGGDAPGTGGWNQRRREKPRRKVISDELTLITQLCVY